MSNHFATSIQACKARGDRWTAMRIAVERRIAATCIELALKAGYRITVDETDIAHSDDASEILNSMATMDEDKLRFHKDDHYCGWVFFVYGNDGWDVINDYTMTLERPFMEAVCKYAESLES